jgi:hypothetical protein
MNPVRDYIGSYRQALFGHRCKSLTISNGMKKFQLITLAVLALPQIALAAPKTFSDLVNIFVGYFNSFTALLVAVVILIYFVGIVNRLYKEGSGDKADWTSFLGWGIAIIFVIVSIVGIIALLENTLQIR